MREKTGRWIRGVVLAVLSACSVALIAGCDPDKDEPADPTPSVVNEETSEETPEDPGEDQDTQPTGDGDEDINPPPPPPTATGKREGTPTFAPPPTATVAPETSGPPEEQPNPDGT
ncbi:hypothetical protein [Streptomyces sp. NPDC046712]|uniref:hypothetical protein n=1 Tax=Streptomyces sp. NPDC046712 TaxID=3154802 RepID=UPI003402A83F